MYFTVFYSNDATHIVLHSSVPSLLIHAYKRLNTHTHTHAYTHTHTHRKIHSPSSAERSVLYKSQQEWGHTCSGRVGHVVLVACVILYAITCY